MSTTAPKTRVTNPGTKPQRHHSYSPTILPQISTLVHHLHSVFPQHCPINFRHVDDHTNSRTMPPGQVPQRSCHHAQERIPSLGGVRSGQRREDCCSSGWKSGCQDGLEYRLSDWNIRQNRSEEVSFVLSPDGRISIIFLCLCSSVPIGLSCVFFSNDAMLFNLQ